MLSGDGFFQGAGIRYGYSIAKEFFLQSKWLQDSLVAEGSLFYYQVQGLAGLSDSYTVVPINFNFRYNILFSQDLALFLSAGVTKNFVVGSNGADGTVDGAAALDSFLPSASAGLIIRIGPKWHVRADLGFDMIIGGLMIRF